MSAEATAAVGSSELRYVVSPIRLRFLYLTARSQSWTKDAKGDAHQSRINGKTSEPTKEDREAKLRASIVVIPANDAAKSVSCPVCKETIQPEFMEDEEEWVWRNAVRVKDKVS